MTVTINLKKKCSKCKVSKFLGDFHKRKDRPLGVTSHCKVCEKERAWGRKEEHVIYSQKSYTKNKDKVIKRSKIVGKEKIEKIQSIKENTPCADCGITFSGRPEVLDFDHRDPSTKLFNLSQARWKTWADIELEIAKCDIVCSNCHRTRTKVSGIAKASALKGHEAQKKSREKSRL